MTALACTPAPTGHGRWTLRLLADQAVELGLVDTISHEMVSQLLKKRVAAPPPAALVPGGAAFAARMEDVLAVYERPYHPLFPVVCFDERPCVLHGQPMEPLPPVPAQPAQMGQPAKAGRPRRESSTYVRQGTACLLAAFEPGIGQRLVEVSARRAGADYCRFMQQLAAHYPHAEKIVFVQDNLNTHTDTVFYQHLPAAQARALAIRFEVHYTPKNASWLNMVELELSAIARQCLHQRIPTLAELTAHVAACVAQRNADRATVHWQFTLAKARIKLDRHY